MSICIATIPPSYPEGKATKTKPVTSTIFQIELPVNIPTGQDPREPPIDCASGLPIKLPISQTILRPKYSPEEETKTRTTKPNPSLSHSPDQNPSCSHNLPIDITREFQISQSIPQSPD